MRSLAELIGQVEGKIADRNEPVSFTLHGFFPKQTRSLTIQGDLCSISPTW